MSKNKKLEGILPLSKISAVDVNSRKQDALTLAELIYDIYKEEKSSVKIRLGNSNENQNNTKSNKVSKE